MVLLFGFFFFFLYIHILAFQISQIKNRLKLDLLDLLSAIVLFTVLVSISSWFGINLNLMIFLPLLFVLIIQFSPKYRIKNIKTSFEVVYFYAVFIILEGIYGLTNNFQQKVGINPDPFGYAAVTGAVNRYGSFNNLLQQFEPLTGTKFSFFLNWDDPSAFTKLKTPWMISDSTIKYGIANGSYLHNGLSFILRPFTNYFEPIEGFIVGWKFFTILFSSLLISILLKTALIISRKFKISNNINKKNQDLIIIIVGIFLLTLPLNSRWFSILILEGFGNQIFAYLICIGTFVTTIDNKNLFRNKVALFELMILFFAQFFVYAQQIPFQILCLLAGIVYSDEAKVNIRKFSALIISFFIIAIITFKKIPFVSYALGVVIGSSHAGGSTHTGMLSNLKVSGLLPDANFSVFQFRDDNTIENVHKVMNWGWYNSSMYYPMPAYGYDVELTSIWLLWAELALTVLILVTLLFKLKKNQGILVLNILLIPLSFLQIIYLFFHTIIDKKTGISDYAWMRITSYTSIYIWLAITIFLTVNLQRRLISKIILNIILIYLIIFLSWSIFNTGNQSLNFNKFSLPSKIVNHCPEWFSNDKPNFISSDGTFPQVLLTLCKNDIRFFDDSWGVTFLPDKGIDKITELRYNKYGKIWEINIIPKIDFVKDIKSPCDIECINNSGIIAK